MKLQSSAGVSDGLRLCVTHVSCRHLIIDELLQLLGRLTIRNISPTSDRGFSSHLVPAYVDPGIALPQGKKVGACLVSLGLGWCVVFVLAEPDRKGMGGAVCLSEWDLGVSIADL